MYALSRGARSLAASTVIALAACAGQSGTIPQAPHQDHAAAVQFNIKLPQSTHTSARKPAYISGATASANISVQQGTALPSSTTIKCSTTSCSGTVQAPIGTDTFTVSLLDQSSNVLSKGQTSATIAAGQANTVNVTFDGVVNSLSISLPVNALTTGVSSSVGVVVSAKDAGNYVIIGAQPYDTPIALTLTDGSNSTSLSAAQVKSPEDAIQLSYNGSSGFSGATISASVPGSSVTTVTATATTNGAGSLTSLQGYKQISLPGDGSANTSQPFGGMTSGSDGRLWVGFDGTAQSGLYAIDPITGAATFYPIKDTAPGVMGAVNGYIATIDKNHNDGGYGDLVLYNTDGTLAQRYTAPAGAATLSASNIFQGSDGNVYVIGGGEVSELALPSGVWSSHWLSWTSITCGTLSGAPWTVGSDGNFYNDCDSTHFLRYDISSQTFSTLQESSDANSDILVSQPELGSDNNLYVIHELADTTSHTIIGYALGVSSGTGGATTTYTYPASLSLPNAIIAAAQDKLAFLPSDANKNYSNVLELFDQSSHTFSEYVDTTAGGSWGITFGTVFTTIRNSSGAPIGIAFNETSNTIGIYTP